MVLEVMRLGEPVLMKEALPVRIWEAPDSASSLRICGTPCMPRAASALPRLRWA